MTYAVPLKVTFRLFVYDKDPETGTRMMRDAKEEEVYFGEIPLMTDYGTFIINGTERVIVSQLHRSRACSSPRQASGARAFLAKIIPYRGSWVEFEYDHKDSPVVRIDRKRKFHGTVFLRALGLETDEQILRRSTVPISLKPKCPQGESVQAVPAARWRRQEKLKDLQTPHVAKAYPMFAGIVLDKKEIGKLEDRRSTSLSHRFEGSRPRALHPGRRRRSGDRRGPARGQRSQIPEDLESSGSKIARRSPRSRCSSPIGSCAARSCRTPLARTQVTNGQGGADRDLPSHASW